jgi:hypothetical protein
MAALVQVHANNILDASLGTAAFTATPGPPKCRPVKRNPAAFYTGIRSQCSSNDAPMGTASAGNLASDLANKTLPSFSS